MNLFDEIQTVVKRLEDIKNLQVPDIDCVEEQVDDIENNLLPQLDNAYDEYMDRVYEKGDSDEETARQLDKLGDLFIQAEELILEVREKYGLNYFEDDEVDSVDDDIVRSVFGDDEDDEENMSDEYEIVLQEISKSALGEIDLEVDYYTVALMGNILVGIASNDSDETIAAMAFSQMVLRGYVIDKTPEGNIEKIKEICNLAREKCKKQVLGLQIAYSSLDEYHCSAAEALSQIQMFL
jgi:hypothetical protein